MGIINKKLNVDVPFEIKKDKSEAINKVVMQYTDENNFSVEFYGGFNVLLFNLKKAEY